MKKKNIILVLISSIFIILVIYININYKLTKKEDISKKEDNIKPLVTNIAMLSKPLGTTTFTEITSTPTTGSWTIETDCRGMTVTWDDKTHRLKTSITQTPASCKLKFIEKEIPRPTLRDAILADNTLRVVENDSMFAHISPADKSENGLWKEARAGKTEGDKPTYFFRGSVQNNYVSFAGKMWRIVRINEDGTVKLILGGNNVEDGYIDSATHVWYLGYDSSAYVNYVGSTVKTDLDAWYNSNITGVNNTKVVTWNMCNDKSATAQGNGEEFGAFTRQKFAILPQFKCPNVNDNISVKGGLLTADEVAYAGGRYYDNNQDYYLYDNAKRSTIGNSGVAGFWWTASPFRKENAVLYMFSVSGTFSGGNSYGNLGESCIRESIGLRAVISLASGILTVSGNGTKTSPYVI